MEPLKVPTRVCCDFCEKEYNPDMPFLGWRTPTPMRIIQDVTREASVFLNLTRLTLTNGWRGSQRTFSLCFKEQAQRHNDTLDVPCRSGHLVRLLGACVVDTPDLAQTRTAAEIKGLGEGCKVNPTCCEHLEALEEAAKTSDSLCKYHKTCHTQEANKTEIIPVVTMDSRDIDDSSAKNGIMHPDNRFMMSIDDHLKHTNRDSRPSAHTQLPARSGQPTP
jgi:hypothetical protein